jgi:hypothetical protein
MATLALYALAKWVLIMWPVSGLGLLLTKLIDAHYRPTFLRFLYHELKPFYLPALAAYPVLLVLHGGDVTVGELVYVGFSVLNWFVFKDGVDDDDRWKRRLRKLAERIERSGSRLVVVPAGGER